MYVAIDDPTQTIQGNENNKAKNSGLSWPVHPSFVYVAIHIQSISCMA